MLACRGPSPGSGSARLSLSDLGRQDDVLRSLGAVPRQAREEKLRGLLAHLVLGLDGDGVERFDADLELRDSGVCFDFSYSFFDQRQGSGASIAEERWCSAPPRGELVSLEYREDVVDVAVWDSSVQATRDMPPAGWNCPIN